MDSVQHVINYAKDIIKRHPELKSDVADIVSLMQDEIADGGSVTHEVDLAYDALQDLDK